MPNDPASPELLSPQQLAHMQTSGTITSEEVHAMESGDAKERDAVMREIQVRHATGRLDAAVATGAITREEASDLMEQVEHEHSKTLRARINKATRQRRA